jgi:hypothetical protein
VINSRILNSYVLHLLEQSFDVSVLSVNTITALGAACIPAFSSPLADLRTPHHTYHQVLFKMLASTLSFITVSVKFTSNDNLLYLYCTVFNNSIILIIRKVRYIWNTLQSTKSFPSAGLTSANLFNLARLYDLWRQNTIIAVALLPRFVRSFLLLHVGQHERSESETSGSWTS